MPNHFLTARLAAHADTRQVEVTQRVDQGAHRVDRLVHAAWKRMLKSLHAPSEIALQVRELLRDLHDTIDRHLNELLTWGHRSTRKNLARTLPIGYVRAALVLGRKFTPEQRQFREDTSALSFSSDNLFAAVFPPPGEDMVRSILHSVLSGQTWFQALSSTIQAAQFTPEGVAGRIASSISLGKTAQEVAKNIRSLVDNVRGRAMRIARTYGLAVAQRVQEKTHEQLGDLIEAWQVRATLDLVTRPAHRARHGTIYYRNPQAGQPGTEQMPHPPLEADGSLAWNCRCILIPVLKHLGETASHPAFVSPQTPLTPDPAVYDDWFSQATDAQRRIAVGSKRYAAAQKILNGEAPRYAHFVDPESGELLSIAKLKNETPAARAKRMAAVQADVVRRQVLMQQVSTFGSLPPPPLQPPPTSTIPEPPVSKLEPKPQKSKPIPKSISNSTKWMAGQVQKQLNDLEKGIATSKQVQATLQSLKIFTKDQLQYIGQTVGIDQKSKKAILADLQTKFQAAQAAAPPMPVQTPSAKPTAPVVFPAPEAPPPQPTTPTPPPATSLAPPSKIKFPDDPHALTVVRTLGGSTGAQLVKDSNGTLYVRKLASPERHDHLREEFHADQAYRALGLSVPEGKLYETANGPVKLTQHLVGKSLKDYLREAKPEEKQRVLQEVRKGFAADALLGNWDVVGMNYDNILVTPLGEVYRIDNGGSMRYRAQGAKKQPKQFGAVVGELQTLLIADKNPQTADIFNDLDFGQDEVRQQVRNLLGKRRELLTSLPIDLQPIISQRLDYLAQWHDLPSIYQEYRDTDVRTSPPLQLMPKDFAHQQFDLRNGLLPKEKRALRKYTGDSYSTINKDLREHANHPEKLEDDTKKTVDAIHAVYSDAAEFPEPVTAWRGIKLTPDKKQSLDELLARGQQDQLWLQAAGINSLSLRPDKAMSFGDTLFEVRLRKGIYVDTLNGDQPLTKAPKEFEVLTPHNSTYRILGSKTLQFRLESGTMREKKVIQLEQVPHVFGPTPAERIVSDDLSHINRLITPEELRRLQEEQLRIDTLALREAAKNPSPDLGLPVPLENPIAAKHLYFEFDDFQLVLPDE